MTDSYALTPEAEDDVFEIWQYIALDSPSAADRVEAAIYAACEFLGDSPYAGRVRPEFTQLAVRFWSVQRFPNYVIVYRAEVRPVRILRVLHSQRDVPTILNQ